MSIRESALSVISAIAQSDFVRAVTSDGNSRRVTVANLAKAIVESYTGSSLGGSQRSVKAAIDALNSNTVSTVFASADTSKYTLNNVKFIRRGDLYILMGEVKCISPSTSASIGIVSSGMPPVYVGQVFVPAWGANNSAKDALGVNFGATGVALSYGTAGGYYELSIPMLV